METEDQEATGSEADASESVKAPPPDPNKVIRILSRAGMVRPLRCAACYGVGGAVTATPAMEC